MSSISKEKLVIFTTRLLLTHVDNHCVDTSAVDMPPLHVDNCHLLNGLKERLTQIKVRI